MKLDEARKLFWDMCWIDDEGRANHVPVRSPNGPRPCYLVENMGDDDNPRIVFHAWADTSEQMNQIMEQALVAACKPAMECVESLSIVDDDGALHFAIRID